MAGNSFIAESGEAPVFYADSRQKDIDKHYFE